MRAVLIHVNEDFDNICFKIFFTLIILIANGIHTYIMIVPSHLWCGYSAILIAITSYHYLSALGSICLLFEFKFYMENMQWLRRLFLVFSYISSIIYLVLAVYEVYMIVIQDSLMILVITCYLGYMLLANITILPQTLYIIIKESTLNDTVSSKNKINDSQD